MTSINKPGSPESVEKPKPKSPIAASRQLIQEYIRTTFPNPALRGKLLQVLKAKKVEDINDFYQGVNSYLSLSGDLIDGPYSDITEKDLREIGLIEIKNFILRESVGLENQVKTIKHRIFSEWEESSFTPDQKNTLQQFLMDENNYTLRNLTRSRDARGRFLNQYLGNTTNLRTVDFDTICNDIAITNPTEEQKRILEKWMKGYNISEKDIGALLESMDRHTVIQKKKIIQYFVPTVSLGFLLTHHILSRESAIDTIIHEIQEIYPTLTDDEIEAVGDQAVDKWIAGDHAISVQTSRLTDTDISTWWNNKKARKELADIIESDLIHGKGSLGSNDLDLEADADGKLHTYFLKKMRNEFSNKRTGMSQIENIENMSAGSIIKFFDPKTGKADYIQVEATDIENEDGHEGMQFTTVATNGKIITDSIEWRNYQDVPNIFHGAHKLGKTISILSSAEFDTEKNKEELLPDINENNEPLTLSSFIHYLDEKDPNGKNHKFQKGYTIQYEDTDTGVFSFIRIESIDEVNGKITLKEGDTSIPNISFKTFLDVFIKHKFLRLPRIDSDEDFVSFVGISGLIAKDGLKMEGGSHGDEHGHDDHAHGHAEHIDVKALTTEDGKGHVLVKSSDKGQVVLQEYRGQKSWEDLKKEDPKMKKFDGKKALYTKPFTMDYMEFAAYAKNAKLVRAVSHDPLTDQDNYTDEEPFHMHHSFLKSFLNIGTVGDLMKAFEMSWHALEHTMEKGQKINAAKFMYRMFGNMEGDIGSQMTADYVEAVGDTIEKIKKKINGFNNGLKKRNKCLHLLQDKASKPEEIAAALMVTVEGSGGLYMDNPFVGYAGSWMWFNALVRAAGYSNPAAIKAGLADKVKEVNKENPTEEMYIEQFLKKYGEVEQNPLLMAMGGYPKFRKALIEGRKGEMEKGERDAGELLGADDRVQLGVNKMITGEYPQVLGIYKSAMGKYAGGPADVIPWMWALSGATKIVHPNIANEFKNFTEAQGFTFHAISFCRSPETSDIYKRVVGKIIHAKVPEAAAEYDKIQKLVDHQFSGHHHRTSEELEEYNKKIMNGLRGIWDKYGSKIHPILQGTSDSYIFEHQDDPDLRAYTDYLNQTHDYRGSGGQGGINKDYGYVDGYKKSPSFGFTDVKIGEKTLRVRDIKRQLDWIRIHGQNAGSIENDLDTHVFKKSILPFLKGDIKNIDNPEQQRATYIANYEAILHWIRQHLGGLEGKRGAYNGALAQRYMQDLTELGYDLSFETVIENSANNVSNPKLKDQLDRKAAEASYGRFVGNNAWNTTGEVADTKSRLDTLTSAANSNPILHPGTR